MLEREFKQETHQLEKIFEVTGTPAVEDIAWMEEGSMKTVWVRFIPVSPESRADQAPELPSAASFGLAGRNRLVDWNASIQ